MACNGGRSYLKDLRSLYINIEVSTNEQASISSVCGDKLEILLTPNEGSYAHAMFILEIVASDNYPRTRPKIRFLTPIFHPNISADEGYICLSLMDNWNRYGAHLMLGNGLYLLSVSSCYSFIDIIKAVLFLLANPNFDSANNSFGSLSPEYRDRFDEVCKQFLAGFPIKGAVYPANEKWCEWARANNCFPVPKRDQSGDGLQPPTHLTADITLSDGPTTSLEEQLKAKVKTQLSDLDLTSDRMSSSTPSTSVPSVANVRYSVGTDSDRFGSVYTLRYNNNLQNVCILLYQQENRGPRVFYFSDFLGCPSCQNSREPVYFCSQTDLETPTKSSSFINWSSYFRDFYRNERYSSYSYSPRLSCISTLFHVKEVATNAYELFPDCGNYVLCALFAEPRSKSKQIEDDPLDGSATLEDFFNLSCEIDCAHSANGHKSVVEGAGGVNGETEEDESISVESFSSRASGRINSNVGEGREKEDEEEEEEDSYAEDTGSSEDRTASEDSLNYLYTRPREVNYCGECFQNYRQAVEVMQKIKPSKWIFFQTRWPPVLAPKQVIDFGTNYPVRIPSWRGSTPRLVKDIVIFCRQHSELGCLLLLDPLALSPWSPVLNALCPLAVDHSSSSPHHLSAATTCRQRWTSLLWLTVADTSGNMLIWPEHLFGSKGSPWLHAVARLALLSNWLAWFSRVEITAVLGQLRHSDRIVCEGVATACLHPASLGCGQAPFFDVWPLWLARLILRSSCGLFTRFCASVGTTTRCYFPLSDTDEI